MNSILPSSSQVTHSVYLELYMEKTNVSRFAYDRFNNNFEKVIELGFNREFVRYVASSLSL